MKLRATLPDHHRSGESMDTVKVGIGLIATMTALLLGLVTASAKASFDATNAQIKQTAADILSLDRALARYGPETAALREAFKATVASRIDMIWPRGHSQRAQLGSTDVTRAGERLAAQLRSLAPQTDDQQSLRSRAMDLAESLLKAPVLAFAGQGASVPYPFLAALVFWLTITFVSFGLSAPRNATVVAVLFLCAVSVAGAVFLVLEMDGPFEGWITVSPDPLKYALARLGQ